MRYKFLICLCLMVALGAGDIYGDPGRGFGARAKSGGWFGNFFSSSSRSKPPIGWNVNYGKKLPGSGTPPAYPGLDKSAATNVGSGKIPPPRPPPPYSALDPNGNKNPPPPYSALDQLPNGIKTPPPRPPPPYSSLDQSPPPAYSAPVNQPPIVHPAPSAPIMILNTQPAAAPSSSLFGGSWLSNMLFYGLGSMNSYGSHPQTIHHYHDSSTANNQSHPTVPAAKPVTNGESAILLNGTTTESTSLLNKLNI